MLPSRPSSSDLPTASANEHSIYDSEPNSSLAFLPPKKLFSTSDNGFLQVQKKLLTSRCKERKPSQHKTCSGSSKEPLSAMKELSEEMPQNCVNSLLGMLFSAFVFMDYKIIVNILGALFSTGHVRNLSCSSYIPALCVLLSTFLEVGSIALSETGVPVLPGEQFFRLERDGSYLFAYDTGMGEHQSFRVESRDRGGRVKGRYGYVDPDGVLRITDYRADHRGYRASFDIYHPISRFPSGTPLIVGPLPPELGKNRVVQDEADLSEFIKVVQRTAATEFTTPATVPQLGRGFSRNSTRPEGAFQFIKADDVPAYLFNKTNEILQREKESLVINEGRIAPLSPKSNSSSAGLLQDKLQEIKPTESQRADEGLLPLVDNALVPLRPLLLIGPVPGPLPRPDSLPPLAPAVRSADIEGLQKITDEEPEHIALEEVDPLLVENASNILRSTSAALFRDISSQKSNGKDILVAQPKFLNKASASEVSEHYSETTNNTSVVEISDTMKSNLDPVKFTLMEFIKLLISEKFRANVLGIDKYLLNPLVFNLTVSTKPKSDETKVDSQVQNLTNPAFVPQVIKATLTYLNISSSKKTRAKHKRTKLQTRSYSLLGIT